MIGRYFISSTDTTTRGGRSTLYLSVGYSVPPGLCLSIVEIEGLDHIVLKLGDGESVWVKLKLPSKSGRRTPLSFLRDVLWMWKYSIKS